MSSLPPSAGTSPTSSQPSSSSPRPSASPSFASISAFARAKALALEKTVKLRENSAQFSELAKEKGATWKAKAMPVASEKFSELKNAMSSSKGRKDRDAEKWKFGKKSPGQSSSENSLGLVFGAPLQQAVEATRLDNSTALPGVAVRCIEYLDAKGLQEVGLYRIPGSTTTVNKLRAIFDSGSDLAFDDEGEDPNAVATLLKMYLRELPETVLTPALEPEFHHCLSNYDHERSMADPSYEAQIVEDLARVTLLLPEENYQLLAWLMCHLARVDYYSDVNKMNGSNLGLIFCPTMGITSVLFRYFLRNSEKIFPLPKPDAIQPASSEAQGMGNTSSTDVSNISQSKKENGEYDETADDVFYDLSASVLASPPRNRANRESRIMGREELSYRDPTQSQNERHEHNSKSSGNKREYAFDENSTSNSRPGSSLSNHKNGSKNGTPKPPPHTVTAGLQSSTTTSNGSLKKSELAVSFGDLLALSGGPDQEDNDKAVPQSKLVERKTLNRSSSLRGITRPNPLEQSQNHKPDQPVPFIVPSPRAGSQMKSAPPFASDMNNSSSPLYHPQISPTFPTSPSKPDETTTSPDSTATAMGAFLGIVGKEGGRIRDSTALFDYFYNEAERRIKMQEGSNDEIENSGSVNLMD